ncbi:myosin II heavy chain [Ephemerocybe angulata]|uniref:Myosin II heavy chain n=1 Tax=Ephemerocybe angulata TaxID=980116 RepID=A0A8H6HDS4_9AGAR|nr:myosin II heavy chain [Tulosesus angulatus]
MASTRNGDAARAAALQAEFNEKKWVWVPDTKEGYLAGWVNQELEEDDAAEVVMSSGGEIRKVPFDSLFKMNPPKFDRVEDIADLTFLNEASVVHNLRLRYGSGAIYTYSGLFLVAINPYQHLPLYSDAIVQQYRGKRRDENPPHIFEVAERAWVNMGDERENQSILITGESGAGKTESTKKVIQYLAAIAADAHPPPPTTPSRTHSRSATLASSSILTSMPTGLGRKKGHSSSNSISATPHLTAKGRLGLLERQILEANPILEAFGNAQTQRNNNSSRFGKFVRIMFSPDGSIAGANIDCRVVYRNEAERSFHVFYQLLAGASDSIKESLLLEGAVADYEYLNKSRREVDGVDDREEWYTLKDALDTVGFSQNEQHELFRIIAAILHIGNIEITSSRGDEAMMPDPSQAERVCHLLGIPIAEFTRAVLRPRTLAGREWVSQSRTQQQALDELSALCKTLYEKSFGALVDRINKALDRPSSKANFIGVLDIAGFEIFDVNSYEQLLINYTNEKLQQFFNHHMFVLEQEEYTREGIKWDYVNFGLDLQPTIDLIESTGQHIGILSCLDEECIMPKATDLTFTNKLSAMWAGPIDNEDDDHPGRDKFEPSRFHQGFVIQHYAAKVEYRTDGWLEKNKDPLNDNLTKVLAASGENYVSTLFAEYAESPNTLGGANNLFTVGRKRAIKKAFQLMGQLRATQPHFVRCIVPNTLKKPGRVDVPLVLDQLRCNGVLEGIRIARLGYPNRLPFVEFRQRYEVLTPGIIPRGYMDGREACRRMVNALELDDMIYRIGTSKIFFKAGVLAELEERRDALLYDLFSRLQAMSRMWVARRQMRKILNRAVAIRTIQRNARVRPLLAATRNDEELRKREVELHLARERAEREKKEKEALETLRMSLESEKRRIEDQLAAERSLTLDKDALLERNSHLDRALRLQKESEEKHESLRQAFDQAAEHLVRLEVEQKEWEARELEMSEQLSAADKEIENLRGDSEELQKVGEELKNLALQREEDIGRTKERSDLALQEAEAKLKAEAQNRELWKDKYDSMEKDARQSKEQLAEMARTANEYSAMLTKKEEQIADVEKQVNALTQEREKGLKEIVELQRRVWRRRLMRRRCDERHSKAKRRNLLTCASSLTVCTKSSPNLVGLRWRPRASSSGAGARQPRTQEPLVEPQVIKSKRGMESELQALRTRQHDVEDQIAEANRSKALERQLVAAQAKYRDFEDVELQFERDRENFTRQIDAVKKQLDSESTKRSQLERSLSTQKQEVAKLKDRNAKLDRELNTALDNLKERESSRTWRRRRVPKAISSSTSVACRLISRPHSLRLGNNDQLQASQRSKDNLEAELERLVDETDANNSFAKLQRQSTAVKIREHLEQPPLKELQLADEALNKEITARAKVSRSSAAHELPAYNPSTPKKRSGGSTVSTPRELSRTNRRTKSSRNCSRTRAEARRAAETAQIDGVQAMWTKFQKTLADEREGYARLDESRKALLVQQRTVQAELDAQKAQNREFTQVKSRLQDEIREARQQAEQAKAEASDANRGQDAEVKTAALSAAREELKTVIEAYKTKESGYVERIEATEIARAKAARGEAAARRALSDLEKQHEELAADRKKLQDRLRDYDKQIRDLKGKLSDGGRETSETDLLRQHLSKRHQKDLTDRDFTIDQTRKIPGEELQSQRDNLSRLREENRKLRSDYDELHLRLDDEVYNSGGWKKEKERMETKIRDLEKAYEASTGGQAEQQSQIVALHSQVRELRAVLDDAEADRALLQKARHSSKMSADAEFQRLHLRKQDLERSLEEQEDRVNNSLNRMKKAESYANDCQMELGKIRVENSELERLNASLEKQIKELNTRSYASPSRLSLGGSRKVDPKIEELSSQLQSSHKDKSDTHQTRRRTQDLRSPDVPHETSNGRSAHRRT